MKPMNLKNYLTAGIVLAFILVAGSAVTQEQRMTDLPAPCPHPLTLTLGAPPPSPPTPDPADFAPTLTAVVAGSVWNQTAVNKHFGHTFHFPSPTNGECCLMTTGSLEVRLKCLQGGNGSSSTSGNDDIELIQNHAGVPGFSRKAWPQPAGCVTGAITTVTFANIPASMLAAGRVSFYVEDDTAVLGAKLTLRGCCLK